ncbi:MAG TPA: transcription initiation factor IIB [Candidatus Thermoplasmatota archaeon]|nr:transcription initiation factor IIB [Candidatus Thermoplasmatota archaeon]
MVRPDVAPPFPQRAENADRCPECGSQRIVQDFSRGEVHCSACGIVLEDRLVDTGPDWRAFTAEQRSSKERTGAPLSVMQHDLGLGTVMWGRTDAHGKSIRGTDLTRMRRLQKWDRRSRFKRGAERNLAHALSEIKRMGTSLDVPKSVMEQASLVYRSAAAKDLIRGRSIDSVAAASLYAAMRDQGVPRSLEEMAAVSKAKKREIGRVYKVVAQALGLTLAPVSPASFIPRFASRLRLGNEVEAAALDLVRRANEAEIVSGKDPKSIAAGAIYIASVLTGSPRTQKDVSEASGVTEVTIRNRYKELVTALGLEFDFGR